MSNEQQSPEKDTARLEWLVVGTGKTLAAKVIGSDKHGWSVCDCSNGLDFISRGHETWRAAIDESMEKKP